jgi:hypothetical protein
VLAADLVELVGRHGLRPLRVGVHEEGVAHGDDVPLSAGRRDVTFAS